MSRHCYIVYGLRLESSLPMPGVFPVQAAHHPGVSDVFVCWDGPTTREFSTASTPLLFEGVKRVGGASHRFRVWRTSDAIHARFSLSSEEVDFALAPSGDQIRISWTPGFPVEDVPAFLLGPVMGCLLRLHGRMLLHAGVVGVDAGAVAILADKGQGKSTLVAALASRGVPVLADDVASIVETDGQFFVHPGFPRLRLWPDTLRRFGAYRDDLPRVESIFDKRYLDLSMESSPNHWRFCSEPRPLVAAYVLAPRRPEGKMTVTRSAPAAGLTSLWRHAYADFMLDGAGRTTEFGRLVQLKRRLAVFDVERPDDLDGVTALCHTLVEGTHRINT